MKIKPKEEFALHPKVSDLKLKLLHLSDRKTADRLGITARYWRDIQSGRVPGDKFLADVTKLLHGMRASEIPLTWSPSAGSAAFNFAHATEGELVEVEKLIEGQLSEKPNDEGLHHVLASVLYAQVAAHPVELGLAPVKLLLKAEDHWKEAACLTQSGMAKRVFENNALSMRYFLESKYERTLKTPADYITYRDKYRKFAENTNWLMAWIDTLEMSGQTGDDDLIKEDFSGFKAAYNQYGENGHRLGAARALLGKLCAMDGTAPQKIMEHPAFLAWWHSLSMSEAA
ncbi:hypothetical protein [Sedimenticola sp.]|uniref:hypothetical protein n=1 Tax=Sedimenticola sp. TaxID=1940285 RepID=UPI003D139705